MSEQPKSGPEYERARFVAWQIIRPLVRMGYVAEERAERDVEELATISWRCSQGEITVAEMLRQVGEVADRAMSRPEGPVT